MFCSSLLDYSTASGAPLAPGMAEFNCEREWEHPYLHTGNFKCSSVSTNHLARSLCGFRTSVLHLSVCTARCFTPGVNRALSKAPSTQLPLRLPMIIANTSAISASPQHLNKQSKHSETNISGSNSYFLIHFINKQLRILLQVAARVAHAVDGALCGVRHDAIRVQLFIIERLGTALLHHQLQPFSCVRVGSPTARSLLKVFIALPLCL